jgi:hypothetical protein
MLDTWKMYFQQRGHDLEVEIMAELQTFDKFGHSTSSNESPGLSNE